MEYKRKHRWANYGSVKCKEYLRNDFVYECAYCKLNEADCGLTSSNFFEVDHFIPQSTESLVDHRYANLFYSCQICNSKKGNSTNVINPCEDDVWGKHIGGGFDAASGYQCYAITTEGTSHIDALQLNARIQVRWRKQLAGRDRWKEISDLVNAIQCQLEIKQNINDEILTMLQASLNQIRCKKQVKRGELFELAIEHLSTRHIKSSIILDEYNLDISIELENNIYKCELEIDSQVSAVEPIHKFVAAERLMEWQACASDYIGILYFFPKANKMYFYPAAELFETVTGMKKRICLEDKHLL